MIAAGMFIVLRLAAQGRPRRLRPGERAAPARRAHRAASSAACCSRARAAGARRSARCCRSSGCTARRPTSSSPTRTARRASAARSPATTSTRRSPTWPTSTTPTRTGAATASCSRRRSRASCSRSSTCPRRAAARTIAALYGAARALPRGRASRSFYALDSLLKVSHAQAHDAVRGDRLLALLLVRRPDLSTRRPRRGAPRCGAVRAARDRARGRLGAADVRQGARVHRQQAGAAPRRRRRSRSTDLARRRARWPSHRALTPARPRSRSSRRASASSPSRA